MPKVSVGESFTVALVSGSEKVWKRGGEYQHFPSKNLLSPSAEKLRRGVLYCFTNFGNGKRLDKREGGNQDFPSKIFCLTVPKDYVGESFIVALFSVT